MSKVGVKIIWLHSHFVYWMGGTKYIYEVVKRLKDTFEIIMVVEDASDPAKKYYKELGIKLICMNKLTSVSPFYWLTLPAQILLDIIFIRVRFGNLYKSSSNVLVVSSMFPMNTVAALLPFKHLQYCFEPFAFFHDSEFIKNFPLVKRLLIKTTSIIWKWLDVFASRRADAIITLNHTTAKYIQKIYNVKADMSFTGVDTTHFKPFVGNQLLRKYKGKLIVVHSTDYSPVKGTDRMLKIFANVHSHIPNTHLLITSTIINKEAETNLKQLANKLEISNNVEFLGFVDYKILPQIYSLAKVLVQCSYSERSGTTSMALPVKEAMACGTLAVRYPVENEDVENGITGFLVDPRDTKKMVENILQILKMDQRSYNSSSQKARTYIVNKYNWENTANIIRGNIEGLIKKQ